MLSFQADRFLEVEQSLSRTYCPRFKYNQKLFCGKTFAVLCAVLKKKGKNLPSLERNVLLFMLLIKRSQLVIHAVAFAMGFKNV